MNNNGWKFSKIIFIFLCVTEQGTEQLCAEMAKQSDLQALELLQQLNQLDLNMIKAG